MTAAAIAQPVHTGNWYGNITPTQTEELVARARIGDQKAFASLYREYVQLVHRYVGSRVHDRQKAEDIVAEVFVRALRNISKFEFRGIEFSAWLVRIARNLIVDQGKSRLSTMEVLHEVTPEGKTEDHADLTIAALDAQVIRSALADMIPEHRRVLELRFIDCLNINETAHRMSKTPGAVRVLQFRALKAMKRYLDAKVPHAAELVS